MYIDPGQMNGCWLSRSRQKAVALRRQNISTQSVRNTQPLPPTGTGMW